MRGIMSRSRSGVWDFVTGYLGVSELVEGASTSLLPLLRTCSHTDRGWRGDGSLSVCVFVWRDGFIEPGTEQLPSLFFPCFLADVHLIVIAVTHCAHITFNITLSQYRRACSYLILKRKFHSLWKMF